jgi:hypothetical protein
MPAGAGGVKARTRKGEKQPQSAMEGVPSETMKMGRGPIPSGAKARSRLLGSMYGLKPVPFNAAIFKADPSTEPVTLRATGFAQDDKRCLVHGSLFRIPYSLVPAVDVHILTIIMRMA